MKDHEIDQTNTPSKITPGALKLKDACDYLGGIAPVTVRRLVARGQLRANRTTRHLIFSIRELDRFLDK